MPTIPPTRPARRRSAPRSARAWLTGPLLAALVQTTACDRALHVTEPDIVTPSASSGAPGATSLYAGAVSDWVQAYDGTGNSNANDGLSMFSGLLADEFKVSDTFNERIETDARSVETSNAILNTQFQQLMRANVGARRARIFVLKALPTDSTKLAHLSALTGYTEVTAAEDFCSGVPFATIDANGTPTTGPGIDRATTLARAVAHFDSALAVSNSASITNLARIGKGRALLDAGDFAGAAAAVAAVPSRFIYANQHNASAGDINLYLGVYTQNADIKRYSIADSAGGGTNQIDWRNDPRVPIDSFTANGKTRLIGFDNSRPFWKLHRYFLTQAPTDTLYRDTSLPLATWVEAQLITAEASLHAGNVTAWLGTLNALRSGYGLPATLTDPGAAVADSGSALAARARLHFRERAFWLFATGHRLGDLRRMIRQYGFTQEQVFPIGNTTRAGQSYGTDVNLPIPQQEQNNASFRGCIDRNA